jgi:O-antigen ligase
VGFLMLLKDRQHHFGFFDAIALFAVLAAAVSASASRDPRFALLKVLSLFLLFLYAGTGARLAVKGREARFFAGLLLGCELLVGAFAVYYLALGTDLMGNLNSLGAIVGVAVAPMLLWGTLAAHEAATRRRRLFVYALSMYLVYHSHARASMVAVALSCGLLCVGLRRYRSLITGVAVISSLVAVAAIVQPEQAFQTASTVTSDVMYKGSRESGMLASRQSPWQNAVETIRNHFWFGTGFGTTDKGERGTRQVNSYSSASHATTEFGSSYLAIATWVGMLGVLPFLLLLVLLMGRVFRTFARMRRTGDASDLAIPVAMVVVAGLVHAAFEDWMFAPGYYLCVFYWSMAFMLVDLAPARERVLAARRVPWFSRPRGIMDAPASIR